MENSGNIKDTLNLILNLQKGSCDCDDVCSGCTKPFLGPTGTTVCYNTRPITLYCCGTGTLLTMPYTQDGVTGTSSVFRIENLDCNCATFRILIPTDTDSYIFSNSYFTIDLSCVLAMQCLNDTYVI